MPSKFPRRGPQAPALAEERRHRVGLSVALVQFRLEVERIQVTHAADSEDLNHPFGPRFEVGGIAHDRGRVTGPENLRRQHAGQREPAEAASGVQ